MEGFTAEETCRLTSCTPHQLRYWDRIGLVAPTIQSTGGRPGIRRLYSFRDLVSLRVVKALLEGGMSLQRVRRAIQYLRKKAALEEHLSEVKLATDGQTIYEQSENDLTDLLKEGQLAFFLAIDQAASAVESRAARHLYDKDEFVNAVREIGSKLERDLPAASRRRLHAAR